MMMDLLTTYILYLADNSLILGHRNSEWTGHGPILEQDIALSNISLDLIGQSINFYRLAAARLNEIDKAQILTEDDLAYLREPHEFRNLILLEQSNGDWARTVLRQFYFSVYQWLLFEKLLNCKYPEIAAISEKSMKETRYHLKWSSEWVIRLGDGTEESRRRILDAVEFLNPFVPEFFEAADFDYEAFETGAGILPEQLRQEWYAHVNKIFDTATLPSMFPGNKSMFRLSGKNGVHSDQLSDLLAEMQILQRTYPGAVW
jgi:ring-1,2-phenylacetyl-CoA epoxidase subunit PaaC